MAWLIKARSGIYRMVDEGRLAQDQIIFVNSHEWSEFLVKPKCNEKIFLVEEKKEIVVEKKEEKPVLLADEPTPQPKAIEVEVKEEKPRGFKLRKHKG